MDHITLSNLTAQNRPNKPDTTCGKAHLDEIRNETLYRRWRIPLEMVASNKANRARWTDYGSANRSAHLEKPRRLGEHALKIQAGPGCPQPSFSSWSALNDRSAGLRMSVGRYLYSLSSGPTQRTEPFEWNQDPEQDTPLDPCRMFRCSLTPQTLPLSPGQSPLCPITSWSTYVNYDDLDIAQWLGVRRPTIKWWVSQLLSCAGVPAHVCGSHNLRITPLSPRGCVGLLQKAQQPENDSRSHAWKEPPRG